MPLLVMGSLLAWVGQAFAEPRFSCAEVSRANFLASFNLSENGPKLFQTLLDDQIDGLKNKDACVGRRAEVLTALSRQFSPAALKSADLQVWLGRFRLLEGKGDTGADHFRTALSLQPGHVEALFYAAQRANARGERERERLLLQGLLKADFQKRPEFKELFEQSFERLTILMPASEARSVIDGPWKKLNLSSQRRARRGLEIAHQSKDPDLMQRYFADAFGPGELGAAPDWAYLLRGRYHLLKGEMNAALASFDRSLAQSKSLSLENFRDIDPWLELAYANSSYQYLRRWSERVLGEGWASRLNGEQRSKLERFYVHALQNGVVDAKAPIADLERAQKLVPSAPELLLLSTEVLLSQHPPLQPEGGYRNRKTAFAKARVNLRFLQTKPAMALDASFWELWIDAQSDRWQQVRGRADVVFAEFQRGGSFLREASLPQFWQICRTLYTRTRATKDYSARLKLIANNPQVKESVRQSAETELQNLTK